MSEASAAAAISREIGQRAAALGEAVSRHPAVGRLREAWRVVQEHEAARIMLRDLRRRERALLERQLAGQEPGQEEVEEFRRLWEIAAHNPYLRDLLEAEAAVAELLAAVDVLVRQRLDLPGMRLEEEGEGAAAAASAGPSQPGVTVARTKLWVPGQP